MALALSLAIAVGAVAGGIPASAQELGFSWTPQVAPTGPVLIVIGLAALGWQWTANHQAPAQAAASHVVLALAALAGVVALIVIWRHHPDSRPR